MEIVVIGLIVITMGYFQLLLLGRMEKQIKLLTKEIQKLNDK